MLSTRLLPLLCFLSLTSVSLGQERQKPQAVPETCPVTKPADRFVPPSPYPAEPPPGRFWFQSKPARGQFWFGSDRLWTALPKTGAWTGLPQRTPSDPTFVQKLAFWQQGYDAHAAFTALEAGLPSTQAKLIVSGRRIDSPAQLLRTDGAGSPGWIGEDQFLMRGLYIPTIRCWEITGRIENDELTFVVWVEGSSSLSGSCPLS